jgi:triacylglycerol lipase
MLSRTIEQRAHSKSVNIIAHSMVRNLLPPLSLPPFTLFSLSYPKFKRTSNHCLQTKGGLDARYMLTHLKPTNVKVHSLTTIATPHRGSAYADYLLTTLTPHILPKVYRAMDTLGLPHGAFSQLTRSYMQHEFNPRTPDRDGVRYFSYGAMCDPGWWSVFRHSHRVIDREEGVNDGLVSVKSADWGTYKGTLIGVSHLDLINWTNRVRWLVWELTGNKRK